ncbi:hypothetical protein [Paracoccus pantotrophus]|uniref:hypothetical protein n=1 Tax=Paracoccus pantotrophus TaxID=82367 RepID=UPI0030B90B94
MRGQIMPPRHIHHPDSGLKALSHDPGFYLVRPASISARPLYDLDTAIESVSAVRHDSVAQID